MVNTVQWSALILSSPYDRPLTSYYKKYSSDAKFLGLVDFPKVLRYNSYVLSVLAGF